MRWLGRECLEEEGDESDGAGGKSAVNIDGGLPSQSMYTIEEWERVKENYINNKLVIFYVVFTTHCGNAVELMCSRMGNTSRNVVPTNIECS